MTRIDTTLILVVLAASAVGSSSAQNGIRINVRQSDAIIRAQLQKCTPAGAHFGHVVDLAQRLEREGDVVVAQNDKFHAASVAVTLGHYYNPVNLFFPTYVRVLWDFDRRDRLRSVRIDRYVEGW